MKRLPVGKQIVRFLSTARLVGDSKWGSTRWKTVANGDRGRKHFALTRYFSLTSLLCSALIAVVLGWNYQYRAFRDLKDLAASVLAHRDSMDTFEGTVSDLDILSSYCRSATKIIRWSA